jgi:molybdate transport system regulatory protein
MEGVKRMKAGVRNKLSGTVIEIKEGDVMSEVIIQVGDNQITSVMTTDSLKDVGFEVGNKATALIKAVNVVMTK